MRPEYLTYKEPSIISETVAAIWSKATFGASGHSHPRSSPLPRLCTIPSISAISPVNPGSRVLWSVQHRLRLCPGHLNCVKLIN
jgi:hypothetical protein